MLGFGWSLTQAMHSDTPNTEPPTLRRGQKHMVTGRGLVPKVLATLLALLLISTALVKLGGIVQHSPLLAGPDPVVLGLNHRIVLLVAGVAEVAVALMLFAKPATGFGAALWLTGVFGVYRLGLASLGDAVRPCPCLGYWLPITPERVNTVSLALFWFLAGGSLLGLLLAPRSKQTNAKSTHGGAHASR